MEKQQEHRPQITSIEALQNEMKKRGYGISIRKSHAAAVAFDIMCGADVLLPICEIEAEISNLEKRKAELAKDLETHKKTLKDALDYIRKFENAISECETADGRDALKRAQMFVNSCCVRTAYDNTAYIKGLADILANQKPPSVDKLDKMSLEAVLEKMGR